MMNGDGNERSSLPAVEEPTTPRVTGPRLGRGMSSDSSSNSVDGVAPAFLEVHGLEAFRAALITSLILMIPFNIWFLAFVSQHSPHLSGGIVQNTYVGATDIILIALLLAAIPLLRRLDAVSAPCIVGLSVLAVASFIHVLVDPSDQGVAMTVRLTGAVAVAVVVATMSWKTLRVAVVWPIAIMGLIQGAVAIAQTFTGTGKVRLDEMAAAGASWTAGRGTFGHEYVLAAFLLLGVSITIAYGFGRGMRTILWASVAVAAAAVATTFGRAGALALILIGLVYAFGWWRTRNRTLGVGALSTLGAFTIGVIFTHSGWLPRFSSGSSVRASLASRSLDVIAANPVFGVGPGRYGQALAEIGLTSVDRHIVHNVPLLATAEFGVVLGAAFAIWLTVVGVRSLRSSIVAFAVFAGILPFLLFDNLHYVIPEGVPILGLWCGAMTFLVGIGWRTAQRVDHVTG